MRCVVLVGDGPLLEDTKCFANVMGVSERVYFLGYQKNIPALVTHCDIFVLSSFWEGFGLSAIEGMNCKKPTITSNVPGICEIVHGYGLLFEPGNYHELAAHILELIKDTV